MTSEVVVDELAPHRPPREHVRDHRREVRLG